MSMNLTLYDNDTGQDIELWQTPSYITWMCLSYNPETKEPDGGHEGVRRRYIEWVKSHVNGVWKDVEELHHETLRTWDHIKEINKVKNPTFSFI
jgi:hypothetical protein